MCFPLEKASRSPYRQRTGHLTGSLTGTLTGHVLVATSLRQPHFLTNMVQISFEPGFGACQGLAQKIKAPFSLVFRFSFLSFEGARAISKPAPNPGTHQAPVETLSEWCDKVV